MSSNSMVHSSSLSLSLNDPHMLDNGLICYFLISGTGPLAGIYHHYDGDVDMPLPEHCKRDES